MSTLLNHALQLTCYRARSGVFFGNPTVNTLIIRDHRVEFDIEKNNGSEPNKCDLTITNLAGDTRGELCRLPLTIEIAAGYDGEARHLFTGDLRPHGRSCIEGTEWKTTLQLGDGDRPFRFARVNKSYRAGTSMLAVLRDAVASTGQELPRNIESAPELRQSFANGTVLSGSARSEITRLLAPLGYNWSFQNGRIQILKDDEYRDEQAWLIKEGDGMIGSPEWSVPDSAGAVPKLSVTSLLYPQIQPGSRVHVVSRQVNGIFKVERVTHSGDTEGDTWTTALECKSL